MGVLGTESLQVHLLELGNFGGHKFVEVTTDTSVQNADLFFSSEGHVLLLLEELSELLATVKLLLGSSIKIGTELGEGSDLTILRKLELHGTGNLLHGLDLGSRADTGHGKTDINGGADTLVEKFGFQEDLTVSDGNNVGGNISGHITGLGLNDGKSSKGTTTVMHVHLGGTLEQTGMQIEDIAGIGLTTRGTTEQKRHLTISDSLLGEIIIDDKTVLAVVTEVLTNSATGVGSQKLEGSGIGSSGSNNDRVVEALTFAEETHDVGNGGTLLSNSDIDAIELLVNVVVVEIFLLVKNGVNSNSGFASLTITNNEFTLATANGHLFR